MSKRGTRLGPFSGDPEKDEPEIRQWVEANYGKIHDTLDYGVEGGWTYCGLRGYPGSPEEMESLIQWMARVTSETGRELRPVG